MPLGISRDLQSLLHSVDNFSGRRRDSIYRDIVRKGQAPIRFIATRAFIVGNEVLSRPFPQASAANIQGSHRPSKIAFQNFFVVCFAKLLSSPLFELVRGEGESINHIRRFTRLFGIVFCFAEVSNNNTMIFNLCGDRRKRQTSTWNIIMTILHSDIVDVRCELSSCEDGYGYT